jgi:hypothetical protein
MTRTHAFTMLAAFLLFLVGGSAVATAQAPLVAKDVIQWESKSAKNPTLVQRKGTLSFDDAAKSLVFAAGEHSFKAPYESVTRVVLDEATHMRPRKTAWKQWEEEARRVNGDFWMYVEYTPAGGAAAKHMLQIPVASAKDVVDKTKQVFADRVVTIDVRVGAHFDRKALKDIESKHSFDLAEDEKNHPMPELKPDKALIVVVYPTYWCYGSSLLNLKLEQRKAGWWLANQVKVHANDRVVLVNKVGTYGFAYLDPGDYQLVAQGKYSASALQTTVEAGKAYYFLEDDYDSSSGMYIQFSQHSPELVMLKLNEAVFGVWTRKS